MITENLVLQEVTTNVIPKLKKFRRDKNVFKLSVTQVITVVSNINKLISLV